VLFCDVTGSTALGERLDPEALRRVMARYFAAMTEAIERHGGTVEKFIGDAVMAVFGIPTTHEDDALRSVRAAGDMRDALALLNKELERDHGATLTCRIGVNTGEVVAGDASTRQALVTGDAVNLAARLEQAAPPGQVLISDTTLDLVRDAVVVDAIAPLELKGKSEAVVAFRLLAVHAGAPGVARRMDSPLVGRDRSLAQLRQAFETVAAERVCHLFTVLGPPGVGKSRLVQEALAPLRDDAVVAEGRCLSYGEGITYWPLVEVVRDVTGPDLSDDLAGRIRDSLGDDPSADEVATRIAQLTGEGDLAVPGEEVGWAVRRFFEGLARSKPLVVVLDDLQWGEPKLLDLIDQISDWSRDAPILLVCMARPDLLDARPDWGGGKLHATTAALEPLSSEESDRLVENLLDGAPLEPEARRKIVAAAEGNPLFVEETVAMLVDDGRLRRDRDGWVATRSLDDVSVPPTIQALLAARLDLLDEAERSTLGRASVIGQVFYLGALRDLAPAREASDVALRVQQLVRRDLIRPDVSDVVGEEAFRFHHGLLRDAAYQMLPKESRAELHERFADWLDGRPGMAERDEFVGYHLEQAHNYRSELGPGDDRSAALAHRAGEHLSAAAARAFDRADSPAAENLARRAAGLRSMDDPARAWDLITLGWSFVEQDRPTDGLDAFRQATESAEAAREERASAHAALGETFVRTLVDVEGVERLAELVDEFLPRFREWDDDRGLAIAYLCRSQVFWNACRFARAAEDCGLALPHARAAGTGWWERISLSTSAASAVLGSTPIDEIEQNAEELERYGSSFPSVKGMAAGLRSFVAVHRGRSDDARRLHDVAVEVFREVLGYVPSGTLESRWRLEMTAGDPAAAELLARDGYERQMASGDVGHASTSAGHRAVSCLQVGSLDEARRWAAECRELTASDDVINQYLWRTVEASLLGREGRFDEADRMLDEADRWASQTDEFLDRIWLAMSVSEVRIAEGRPDDARAALERALRSAEEKGSVAISERVRAALAAL
jgi:class 3 adenylate cyclase/tetratricopeptide (TPR) repeat protein